MKTKAIISISFLLLLTLACSSADYAAIAHIEYGTPMPALSPDVTATMPITATITVTVTEPPSWRVCTGVEGGTLRIRTIPGVNGRVVSILSEGQVIQLSGETQETSDGATWSKITNPVQGWVNGRFLCAGGSDDS